MSQAAPNPFTQAASQGYGDFAPTLDDEDQEEKHVIDEEPEGPESPEPEEQDHEINELGFTQTQERSYPTGIESPDEDDDEEAGPSSPTDQEEAGPSSPIDQEEAGPSSPTDQEEAGPSSPTDQEEAGPSSPTEQEEEGPSSPLADDTNEEEEEEEKVINKNQSQPRRRVQIMNDSDNEDDEERPTESISAVPKEKHRHFLKQFTMKKEDSPKKRRNDEQQEKQSKRFREHSDDEEQHTDNIQATSGVDDVVDDIFGKDMDDNEDDQAEVAAELADLHDEEAVADEEEEEEEQQTFDAEEDEEGPTRTDNYSAPKNNIVYDIDLYLEKKAERRRGNRRRGGKNGDVDLAGPDADQFVSQLISQMKVATEEDRIFNKKRQPATAKLLLLPVVEQHLYRADLTEIFLDNGVLNVFKDWLSPLPDKSLPNIKIRESLIKILQQFGVINADPLRDSGIGKALMYLYKHPRETKENKIKLIKIIHDWARPIFNLDTDYKHLSREERQQRDADQASLKRQTSLTGKPKNRSADMDLPFANNRRQDDDDELNKDDDCPRARVPRPSNKDYVVRPVSTVEYSEKKDDGKKKTISRLDEIKRRQQDRKRLSKPMSIVKLSIEGNKMHL